MPTVSPDPSRTPSSESHRHRQTAESFGTDAERYDRARPRYPGALIERIVAGGSGQEVLDVGCGTGIAARQFQAAGCRVLGVEPDARMAEFARSTGVEVEPGTFEEWDPAGRTFDAVVAGQAWHWVDPAVGTAKAARLLRPGGRLALFGHVFEPPLSIADASAEVLQRVVPDLPYDIKGAGNVLDLYQKAYAKAADDIREVGGFAEPEQWRFDWEQVYTRDEWLDFVPTQGILTRLPAAQLTEVLDGVGAAIDAMGGGFTMEYVTLAVTAVRL